MTLTLNRQLLTSRQILVAFARGGLNFTVLLHQLVQWRTEDPGVTISAVGVHHGLSANANAWVTHCENVCQQWQVRLVVDAYDLRKRGWGLRPKRGRRVIRHLPVPYCPAKCWSRQHLDDQCKTFCWR
ncbi:ATP-binding protein [Escherichia coli]